jgi:peroxiredoxin
VALYERFKDQGVVVVGVGLGESGETIRAFAKEFWIPFPLWIDSGGRSPAVFGVYGHPSTILIDRAGRVVGRVRGERDWATDDARRLVEALVAAGR